MPTVADDLDRMTKAQLRAEARLRGIPDKGTKDALLRRLREADDEESDREIVLDDDEDVDDEPRDEDDEEFDDDSDDEGVDDEPRDEDDEEFDDDSDDEDVDDEPRDEDDEEFDDDDDSDDEDDDELRIASNGHARGNALGSLVAGARETLEALTGKAVDAVSGIEPAEGGYRITLEVLEVQRVPATTDVLATYCVDVDDDGDITSFVKTSRYYRNQRLGD